uniref:Uncharacterized protein n=1 Tax=Oryza sativa subsp. japonica TaxID=39947 RepID=Q7F1F5_ORYSJ|nr:hypothetical protein [Oryza sativa Japonica Group]BAD03263.1 hypothetical protein [Oryza sativa Japonica Group]
MAAVGDGCGYRRRPRIWGEGKGAGRIAGDDGWVKPVLVGVEVGGTLRLSLVSGGDVHFSWWLRNGHRFNAECTERWLRVSATCPVCRDMPSSSPMATPLAEAVPPLPWPKWKRKERDKGERGKRKKGRR